MAKRRANKQPKRPAPEVHVDDSPIFALDYYTLIPLALALVFFLGAVLVFPFPASLHDAYAYEMTALRLVQDHVFAYSGALPGTPIVPNASVLPGMVLFLAAFFLPVVGGAPTAAAASAAIEPWLVGIQFLMALGIVLAITVTGRLIGGRRLGLVTGILAACYLPFAWASTVALNEQFGAVLFAWQIVLGLVIARSSTRRSYGMLFGYGVLSAATLMLRPALVFWVPVPLVYLALRRWEPPRQLLGLVLAAAVGFVLIFSPWWIRDQGVVGHFELLRTDMTVAKTVTPAPHDAGPINNGVGPQFPDVDKSEAQTILAVIGEQGSAGTTPLAKTEESVINPWGPQLAVSWQDVFAPDKARFGYVEPATYSFQTLIVLAQVVRYYQWFLFVAALGSLLLVRKHPDVLVLLTVPLFVIAAHYTTQMTVRYMYPAMPAVVVLAGCGLFALWSLVAPKLLRGRS